MPSAALSVLLVDSSPAARYALRLQLLALGARVRLAESAEQALREIERELPDAVLTAPVLSGMNGLELLELLQAAPRTRHVPVAICCTDAAWPLESIARQRGAVALLGRDHTRAELRGLLRTLTGAGNGAVPDAGREPGDARPRPGAHGPGPAPAGHATLTSGMPAAARLPGAAGPRPLRSRQHRRTLALAALLLALATGFSVFVLHLLTG